MGHRHRQGRHAGAGASPSWHPLCISGALVSMRLVPRGAHRAAPRLSSYAPQLCMRVFPTSQLLGTVWSSVLTPYEQLPDHYSCERLSCWMGTAKHSHLLHQANGCGGSPVPCQRPCRACEKQLSYLAWTVPPRRRRRRTRRSGGGWRTRCRPRWRGPRASSTAAACPPATRTRSRRSATPCSCVHVAA